MVSSESIDWSNLPLNVTQQQKDTIPTTNIIGNSWGNSNNNNIENNTTNWPINNGTTNWSQTSPTNVKTTINGGLNDEASIGNEIV